MAQFWIGIILIAVAAAIGWWGTQMASEGWKNWKPPTQSSEKAVTDISKTQVGKVTGEQIQQTEKKHEADIDNSISHSKRNHLILSKSQLLPSLSNTQPPYSKLSNDQLRKEVMILVDKMRGYLERINLREQTRTSYYQQQMRQAKTEAERQIVWDAQTHDSLTSPNLNFEYSEKFKADAILFRDELLFRLPKKRQIDNKFQVDYDHPTNPIGLNIVIDDLEKLAKSLSN